MVGFQGLAIMQKTDGQKKSTGKETIDPHSALFAYGHSAHCETGVFSIFGPMRPEAFSPLPAACARGCALGLSIVHGLPCSVPPTDCNWVIS
jgi:hypothetical protein